MKLKSLIFIFSSIFTFSSFSQTEIKFGIKSGVNFSGFHTGKSTNTDQVNYHVGGISELKISKLIALHAELLYSKKGGLIHLQPENQSIQIDSKLDYIDLPIQMKFYPLKSLSLDFGPQVGILINSKEELQRKNAEIEFRNTKSVDFSVTGGLSFTIKDNYLIQTRYNYGLTEIFENQRYKNSWISLSLGYFIN